MNAVKLSLFALAISSLPIGAFAASASVSQSVDYVHGDGGNKSEEIAVANGNITPKSFKVAQQFDDFDDDCDVDDPNCDEVEPNNPDQSGKKPEQSGKTTKSIEQEILSAHNKYRSEVGVPALKWSNQLAANAQKWADQLARNGSFEHANTRGEGENLWMGTSGSFSFTQMVDSWGSEKKDFKNGVFPDVSTTGNWADVGHYTQIVWKNTTQVGCAGADGNDGNYRLVCRYSPPGNFRGEKPF